ncbi:TPA: hypothetical protein ACX6SG_002920 [Photobacterium damselae]
MNKKIIVMAVSTFLSLTAHAEDNVTPTASYPSPEEMCKSEGGIYSNNIVVNSIQEDIKQSGLYHIAASNKDSDILKFDKKAYTKDFNWIEESLYNGQEISICQLPLDVNIILNTSLQKNKSDVNLVQVDINSEDDTCENHSYQSIDFSKLNNADIDNLKDKIDTQTITWRDGGYNGATVILFGQIDAHVNKSDGRTNQLGYVIQTSDNFEHKKGTWDIVSNTAYGAKSLVCLSN